MPFVWWMDCVCWIVMIVFIATSLYFDHNIDTYLISGALIDRDPPLEYFVRDDPDDYSHRTFRADRFP